MRSALLSKRCTEGLAGEEEARDHRTFLHLEDASDLRVGVAINLAQQENLSLLSRELVERREDSRPLPLAGGRIIRALCLFAFPSGRRAARVIDRLAHRDALEPGRERATTAQTAVESPMRGHEGLLRHLTRSSGVANNTVGDRVDALLIPLDEYTKRFRVTIQHLPHDLQIRRFGHLVTP